MTPTPEPVTGMIEAVAVALLPWVGNCADPSANARIAARAAIAALNTEPARSGEEEWSWGRTHDGRLYIENNDCPNDVRLYINGSFRSGADEEYARQLCAALSTTPLMGSGDE